MSLLGAIKLPMSELAGAVLGSRLALTTVKALQSESSMKPKGVVMLSDSMCTISAIETSTRALKLFFHNRVSEILENMSEIKKYCPMEDISYITSELNPADVGTRGTARVGDIGANSFWYRGPNFLRSRRNLWPDTRDFISAEIPDDEVRGKPASQPVFLACMRAAFIKTPVTPACLRGAFINSPVSPPPLPDLWLAVMGVMNYSNSLGKVMRILARVIAGWKLRSNGEWPSRESIEAISPSNLEEAEKLVLISAMPETANAARAGKLVSLNTEKAGGLMVTRDRLGEESLSRILGVPYLPTLMASLRAAFLYVVRAHEGEAGMVHGSVAETLARCRVRVWIIRARDLCKKVVSAWKNYASTWTFMPIGSPLLQWPA